MATVPDSASGEDGSESPSSDGDSGDRTRRRERGHRESEAITTGTADDRYTRKKCVLITGCSTGIGRETATKFLAEDWRVVATARNEDDVADLADAGCDTLALDVTDAEQVRTAIEQTVELGGAIDCLVNNAGYAQYGPLEDVSTVDLHRQFDVNVYGPHRLTRAALPHMRTQERGRIVNISSLNGHLSLAGMGAYAGSKHALEAMSDALRAEVEEFGIDVVLVVPGPVDTSFVSRVTDELPSERRTPAYEDLYEIIDDAKELLGAGPLAVSPEAVARAILQVSTCAEPPARYPVGPVAQYGQYARYLPDQLRDAGYRLLRRVV